MTGMIRDGCYRKQLQRPITRVWSLKQGRLRVYICQAPLRFAVVLVDGRSVLFGVTSPAVDGGACVSRRPMVRVGGDQLHRRRTSSNRDSSLF
jgi:hypothetical protein